MLFQRLPQPNLTNTDQLLIGRAGIEFYVAFIVAFGMRWNYAHALQGFHISVAHELAYHLAMMLCFGPKIGTIQLITRELPNISQ